MSDTPHLDALKAQYESYLAQHYDPTQGESKGVGQVARVLLGEPDNLADPRRFLVEKAAEEVRMLAEEGEHPAGWMAISELDMRFRKLRPDPLMDDVELYLFHVTAGAALDLLGAELDDPADLLAEEE